MSRTTLILLAMLGMAAFTGIGYLFFGIPPLSKMEFALASFMTAWCADQRECAPPVSAGKEQA